MHLERGTRFIMGSLRFSLMKYYTNVEGFKKEEINYAHFLFTY